jgi:DNA-binding response OmpR family regulator
MGLILLADDSPHAQRMGDLILREEGYEVICAADGESAVRWLAERDPDLLIADAQLPGTSGLELCRSLKTGSRFTRVMLTAGMVEVLDEEAARRAGCDAILRKPFEASLMAQAVRPLMEHAQRARQLAAGLPPALNPEQVRQQVARAVEAELPAFVDEITRRVLAALQR